MNSELREAANSLQASLQRFAWFRAVGIGMVDDTEGLIVYVSRNDKQVRRHIPNSWEGAPVSARKMSQPTPYSASSSSREDV